MTSVNLFPVKEVDAVLTEILVQPAVIMELVLPAKLDSKLSEDAACGLPASCVANPPSAALTVARAVDAVPALASTLIVVGVLALEVAATAPVDLSSHLMANVKMQLAEPVQKKTIALPTFAVAVSVV